MRHLFNCILLVLQQLAGSLVKLPLLLPVAKMLPFVITGALIALMPFGCQLPCCCRCRLDCNRSRGVCEGSASQPYACCSSSSQCIKLLPCGPAGDNSNRPVVKYCNAGQWETFNGTVFGNPVSDVSLGLWPW